MAVLVRKQFNSNKTVFITGGSKGIGLQILKDFLDSNYRVITISRTIPRLKHKSKNLIFIKCDLSSEKALILLKTILIKNIKIDTLINNVGKSCWMPINKIDKEFILEMFQINLFVTILITKILVKYLNKNSSIINISSLASKRGTINNSIYCATKFALNGFTQAISKELGKKGIRVNAICPVLILTPGLLKALKKPYSPIKK